MSSTRTPTRDLALVAVFAAVIAVCSILPGIPMGSGVPITLQTFGVMLAGAVLGPVRGFLAVALYMAVGFAGLPVFAQGGATLGVLAKPSAGYLIAFPIAAFLCGLLVMWVRSRGFRWPVLAITLAGLAASFLVVHPLGIVGMYYRVEAFETWREAIVADMAYWPGDVAKNIAMALVAVAVHRAFPDLLPVRRKATTPAPQTPGTSPVSDDAAGREIINT
ncbi:biotin transporter BioY [Nocardioides gilvus]|uniref:biotin transporter BioY n=1 Tax=Nocardioides gilvus TaxID=1735589 RepID=UPI001951770A|nr:biotin transporter BioY [Nocardioides gilvus]